VTDDPVPPADNSATPDVSAMGDSGGSKTTGIASTDTDQDSVIDGSPLEGEPINNELIGSNLEFGGSPNSTPIPSNGLVNNVSSSDALSQASVNAEAIEVNRQEIQRNTIKIDQAFSRIAANGTAIEANALRITDVEEGLAAVAALPDMYLNPNETWAASSAVAVFGDQVGFGGTLAIRGSDNWSVGASAGVPALAETKPRAKSSSAIPGSKSLFGLPYSTTNSPTDSSSFSSDSSMMMVCVS